MPMKINGHTVPLTLAGYAVVSVLWLGGISWTAADNADEIAELKAVPLQVAKIETDVENIKDDIAEIKAEQSKQDDKLDKILYAVSGAEHDD